MQDPLIVFAEWVPSGVMVHFKDNRAVFFPAMFLLEHRHEQPAIAEPEEDFHS